MLFDLRPFAKPELGTFLVLTSRLICRCRGYSRNQRGGRWSPGRRWRVPLWAPPELPWTSNRRWEVAARRRRGSQTGPTPETQNQIGRPSHVKKATSTWLATWWFWIKNIVLRDVLLETLVGLSYMKRRHKQKICPIQQNIMKHKKTNQGFLTQLISEVSSHGQLKFGATTKSLWLFGFLDDVFSRSSTEKFECR